MILKRTPLFEMHQKYQGKIIDFGGWELPVQYEGIIKEHHRVRTKAGLFDVSHMGEIEVKGDQAEAFVQNLITNDAKRIVPYQVQYSPMCYRDGGVVDDLLVYKFSTEHYLLVVNASNTDKDFDWIQKNAFEGLDIKNVSPDYVQLAVQGPLAESILQSITDFDLKTITFFHFQPQVNIADVPCMVSRTGYTGEDGFEIYVSPDQAAYIWEEILRVGGEDIAPIGLGARDSLRFEAKLPLYGQEIDKDITPLEAGLGFFVKLDADDFIGREVLQEQKQNKPQRTLVEFRMKDRGIARSHYDVEKNGKKIGWVTSGGYSPTLEQNIGLALIDRAYADPGEMLDIIIRNKPVSAEIGKGIFYKKKTKKTNGNESRNRPLTQ
ncbi:MAG: glycine cleavage system aminomethyltransferase GcvT [Bacillota bacterium]|nr:glycine cleavage system aminomethyltransferase GcvT [Bacillota bacterium]